MRDQRIVRNQKATRAAESTLLLQSSKNNKNIHLCLKLSVRIVYRMLSFVGTCEKLNDQRQTRGQTT